MKKQIYILIIFSVVLISSSCSTIKYDTTELPKAVQNYLHDSGTNFLDYELSDTDDIDYTKIEQSFTVYEEIDPLWSYYMKSASILSIDSRRIKPGVFFNPEDSIIYSSSDPWSPPLSSGQIYIMNLIFMNIYKFPIAFKISELDPEEKIIEFIYLQNNLANGFQQIFFISDHDSEGMPITHINHTSFFNCQNGFIDTFLYPSFHRKTINDFHENIFKLNGLKWDTP